MFLRPAFLLGVGLVLVYEFLPQIVKVLRPVAVKTIKAGLAAADQLKVNTSQTRESFEDMMAEARSQYEAEKGTPETEVHGHQH